MLAHGRRHAHIISIGVIRSVGTGDVLHAVSVFFNLTRSSHMNLQRLRTGLCWDGALSVTGSACCLDILSSFCIDEKQHPKSSSADVVLSNETVV